MGEIRFLLNGNQVTLENPDPTASVLDWLRESNHLTGTKEGCNEGDCGACSVSVASLEDGQLVHRAINSCILFLPHLHGKSLTTIEGISKAGKLHPVQSAMVEHHGSQCGFCTPGIVMSLYAAHREGRQDHNDVLAGNLCRCTGYAPIQRAAKAAANQPCPEPLFAEAEALRELQSVEAIIEGAYLPTNLDDFAIWYLENPDATLVAGATDIGLMVTKGLRSFPKIAFLNRLDALQGITVEEAGVRIGAAVNVARFRGAMIGKHSGFVEMLRRYGSVQVRNSGTIGGNIANGSPIGDSPPPLIALSAIITLRRGDQRRELPLEDYYIAYGKQDRQSGEFLESIFIPDQPDQVGVYKISKRFDQDISALCAAFSITVDNNRITAARVAFGGMAAIPKRATNVENALVGQIWADETIQTAMQMFAQDFTPLSDARASASYRLRTAQNLLWRYWLSRNGEETSVLAEVSK